MRIVNQCLYAGIVLLTLLSCRDNNTSQSKESTSPTSSESRANVPVNDTVAVFRKLLDANFLGRNMPGYGGLQKRTRYADTIIFQKEDVLTQHIPADINGFKFKFMTKDEICKAATSLNKDSLFPDFLQLRHFQKRDSVFEIGLQATCVSPERVGTKPKDCIYGLLCGGGVAVKIFRENDSLKIQKTSSWSD